MNNKINIRNNITGICIGLLSFFAFSCVNASNKFILSNDLLSFYVYFFYLKLFCIIMLMSFGVLISKKHFFTVKNPKLVFIRAIILTANALTAALAVKFLPLDIFYSILFIMPLIITLMGYLVLKERFNFIQLLALIIGLFGVLIIIQPVFNVVDNANFFIGFFLAIFVAFTGALAAIFVKKYLPNEKAFSSIFYALLMSFILSIIFLLGDSSNSKNMIPDLSVIPVILISATGTIIGSSMYVLAYQKAKSQFVAPTQYTQMIWGITFGYLLFNDLPNQFTLIGCSIIIVANIINAYSTKAEQLK